MSAMHEPNVAWRFAMFIPGFMHILGGILILFFSTDLPDGNYALLKQTGAMTKENPITVMTNALTNYRCVKASPKLSIFHREIYTPQCLGLGRTSSFWDHFSVSPEA